MEQILYYWELEDVMEAKEELRQEGIDVEGPKKAYQKEYCSAELYAISWTTDDELDKAERGRILDIANPATVSFNGGIYL